MYLKFVVCPNFVLQFKVASQKFKFIVKAYLAHFMLITYNLDESTVYQSVQIVDEVTVC